MHAARKYDIDRTIRWLRSDYARKVRMFMVTCAACATVATASADETIIDYAYSGSYALECGEELLITDLGSIVDGITGYASCISSAPSITNFGNVGILDLQSSNTGDIINSGKMGSIFAQGDPIGQPANINSISNSGIMGSIDLQLATSGVIANALGGTIKDISIDSSSEMGAISNSGTIDGDISVGLYSYLDGLTNIGAITGSIKIEASGQVTNTINIGGVSSGGSVGDIINNGSIGDIEGRGNALGAAAYIGNINNTGDMGALSLIDVSSATSLDNSGTMDSITLDSSSSIGALTNSGTIGGDIYVGIASDVASITNSGEITGSINIAWQGQTGDIIIDGSDAKVGSITNDGSMGNVTVGLSAGGGPSSLSTLGAIDNTGDMGDIAAINFGGIGDITNSGDIGRIYSDMSALGIGDISNSGTIDSIYAGGASSTAGSIGKITNSGTITNGFYCESIIDSVINQAGGTISGGIVVAALGGGTSAGCSMGDLTNHGTITGDITASLTDEFTQTGVFTNDGTWDIGAMTDAQSWLNDFDSTENAVLALTLQSASESPSTMITIVGEATLDGELNVRAGTLVPIAGDTWNFLSASEGISGMYANLGQGDTIFQRGGVVVTINYGANMVTFETGFSNAVVPGGAGLGIFGLGGIIRRRRRKN